MYKTSKPHPQKYNREILFSLLLLYFMFPDKSMIVASADTLSFGPNLINNSSLETTGGTSGVPANWKKGGYGINTRILIYPVTGTGRSATKAIKVSVSGYTSGDAKWYPDDFSVTPGTQYEFSDTYLSTSTSIVTIRYKLSNGTLIYKDIATLPPVATFQKTTIKFTAPANVVSATVFHLLKVNGDLTTDDYSFREIIPSSSNNLVANGDFETVGANTLPVNWNRGGYGSSNRVFTHSTLGQTGNGVVLSVSNYISGDAKWVFDSINPPPGFYTYSDNYISSAQTYLTAEFQNSNGTYSYKDLAFLPASSSWKQVKVDFLVPTGVVGVRIFHLIKSNGTLSLDNVSVIKPPLGVGIFATGAVTFRFDDGLNSQYNAASILDNAGFDGTFYVITQQKRENGYTGYMTTGDLQNLYSRGHEIGSHTKNHVNLSQLSPTDQQVQIDGSRQDLLLWNVGPASSFSYPFGDYNTTTTQIVKSAGYTNAVATISGYISPNSDPYQLEYQELTSSTSLATMKIWVDTAIANNRWLVLAFHDVLDAGNYYSITPANFTALVDYIKQKGVPVVTVSQGRSQMP